MTLVSHVPNFTGNDAIELVRDFYGITATAGPLPAERDQNFLITAKTGERFILKIANALEDQSMLDTQNKAMQHLAEHLTFCPCVQASTAGELVTAIPSSSGGRHFIRLLSFLPGLALANIKHHPNELLDDLGRCIGKMDRALADFDHPGAHRDFHWDLANALKVVRAYQDLVADKQFQALVIGCADDFERDIAPLLPRLRKSVIHNDANDYNILVNDGDDLQSRHRQVVGIIDFGDLVYSYTVGDLAIAVAYAVLDKEVPLAAATHIVKGYHTQYPLTEDEIAALFGLIRMRLCVSACMAAHQQRQRPGNDYLSISQQAICNTLPKLAKIHPSFAQAVFRKTCGLLPVPKAHAVSAWLEQARDTFASVVDIDLRKEPLAVLDLSIASPLLSGDAAQNAEPLLSRRINSTIAASDAAAGIGRWDEARMLYTSAIYSSGNAITSENRTVHMGIDIFAAPGSPVYAPLQGRVVVAVRNQAPLDYGPMIILEHRINGEVFFYTLYGHLSVDSLDNLLPGQEVARGAQIGRLGTPDVNGGWSPHLHFQIILDLLNMGRDFPGVVKAGEREIWQGFSPDPNLILRIPDHVFPPKEPNKAQTLAARKKYIGRNLSIGYREPVKVVRGWKQYLFDETGRRYLDAYNNVPHVGHCHPRVVEAAVRQMSVLNTNTRYLHDHINLYAEQLCNTMPAPLSVCFFVNSASEGNELALRLARSCTGQRDMIVLEAAYHGHTTSLIDISPYKHGGPGGSGAPDWVHTAPIADVYRGAYKDDDPEAGPKYARYVGDIIETIKTRGKAPAGFIAESCPSVGGQIFFPQGYLAAVYDYVRRAGGLCIADEVQTGYGRTGTHFYAFEAQAVVPDIVILGKPIGNGHPISAVVTTPDIADAFDNGMEFFSTFGGNTVSCTIGMTVLKVLQEENLQANALTAGSRMLEGMTPFVERYPIVGDVRGSGLFLGMELVRDRQTLEPATGEASFVVNRMREQGILMGTDGPCHNVLKIRPPMPFSEDNADFLVDTLGRVLAEISTING